MAKAATTPSTEVTYANAPNFDEDALRDLDSFDAAIALTREKLGAEIVAASDVIGNGFSILNGDDKTQLVGLPCMFMGWTFNLGDQGEFVSATVVAKAAGGGLIKAIVNDGSTGIYQQLQSYTASTGKQGGLAARNGLRASRYFYDESDGTIYKEGGPGRKAATTFYIDTSA